MIQDGSQNRTEEATVHVGLTHHVEPMEIKLVDGFKMVLLIHCFRLIVLIPGRKKKLTVFDCQSKHCSLTSISPFCS